MMTDGLYKESLTDFRGAAPDLEKSELNPARAGFARNIETRIAGLAPRNGYALLYNEPGIVTYCYPWTAQGLINPDRLLIYKSADQSLSLRYLPLNITTPLTNLPNGTSNISTIEQGRRLYLSGINAGGVHVLDPANGAVDYAFASPINATITDAEDGAGNCTPGPHNVGFICQSRSGFSGNFCPNNGTFNPHQITVTGTLTAGKKWKVTVSLTAPAEIETISLIYSPTTNLLDYYFVPGASGIGVPPGVPFSFDFTIDIADDVLISKSVRANDNQSWISRAFGSNGDPIGCYAVGTYGKRMVYLCGSNIYVSEPDGHQQITGDQHVIQLPGQVYATAALELSNTLYLLSENLTAGYEGSDADVPVLWGKPRTVGGAHGTPNQNCIAVTKANDSGSNYAIIANPDGLWYFDGNYALKPITYFQSTDWSRINWAAADKIRVIDFTGSQTIMVLAPMDGATTCNKIMCFNYTRGGKNLYGVMPEQIDYYIHDIGDYSNLTTISSFTHPTERVLYPLVTLPKDNNTTDFLYVPRTRLTLDNDMPFIANWRSGRILTRTTKRRGGVNGFRGAIISAYGQGACTIRINRTGTNNGVGVSKDLQFELSLDPEATIERPFILNGENITVELIMSTLGGADFTLKWVDIYYTVVSISRPSAPNK